MPISLSTQAYIFLCSVIGGMLISFLYDLFRIKRKAIKTSKFVIWIEDLLYWIMVSLVMFGVVYYSNEGEIRGYILLGTVLGVILYILLLSTIVVKSSMLIIRIVTRIITAIWRVVSYPIKLILRIIAIPVKFFARLGAKGARRSGRFARNRAKRARFWIKRFKIIRKKI